MNRAALAVALALWLAIGGCGAHAAIDAAPPTAWRSVTVVAQSDPSIVVEDVTYDSGALVVAGQVCRPADGARHPVLVLDHGGFAGLGADAGGGLCTVLARQGDVVLQASYRGEDASQGAVEVCLGEVDDVLAMLQVGLAQPYADPAHVGIHGSSHGGCVTLRAIERGAPVRAASEGFGITDMGADYAFWQQELAAGAGANAATIQSLIDQLDAAVGGPPAAHADAYAARSPIAFTSSLPPALPLMIAHGTDDPLVSLAQSCALVAKVGGFRAYHLDAQQQVVATAPAGCDGLTWLAGPLPSSWPDARYFLVYDGVGHEFSSAGGQAMALALVTFVLAKM